MDLHFRPSSDYTDIACRTQMVLPARRMKSGPSACYSIDDQYMFGPDLLVAPILAAEAGSRRVYLPAHITWKDAWTGKRYEGGQWLDVPAPIETIPLFLKAGSPLIEVFRHTNKCTENSI